MDVMIADVVLCEFYFSDAKTVKKRPVLVLKNNLPFHDFVAIPISSQIGKLHQDEQQIDNTQFEQGGLPKVSKLMLRKSFVVSTSVVIKKYGTLKQTHFNHYHQLFCHYFSCTHT